MAVNRKFKESPLEQGSVEKVAYQLTTTPWSSSPTSPAVRCMVNGGNADSNLLSGSASVNGDVITTPLVQNLVGGATFRLEIEWLSGSVKYEAYGLIECKD